MSITALLAIATGLGLYVAAKRGSGSGPVDSAGTPLGQSRQTFVIPQPAVVELVRSGHAQFAWRELPSHRGLEVFADALSIQGVRLPVSARTTRAIAQLLNASPTTPLLEDLIYDQAEVRVVPQPQDWRTIMSNRNVLAFNRGINQQLAAARKPSGVAAPIVSCVGKSWVLDNASLRHPGRAVNYGLHTPTAPYPSIDGKSKVWQQPGTDHNADHWDYSQTCRLCRYNGGPVPLDRMPAHEDLQTTKLWVEG